MTKPMPTGAGKHEGAPEHYAHVRKNHRIWRTLAPTVGIFQ